MKELFLRSLFRCIKKIESIENLENNKSLYYAVLELCLSFKMIQIFDPSLNETIMDQTKIDIEKIYDNSLDSEESLYKPDVQILIENIGQLKDFFFKYDENLKLGFPYYYS